MATQAHLRDLFFRTSVILKGIDGAIHEGKTPHP